MNVYPTMTFMAIDVVDLGGISDTSLQLIRDAQTFAFQPQAQRPASIHPAVDREELFPHEQPVPIDYLDIPQRHIVVADTLIASALKIYTSPVVPRLVANPQHYATLVSDGARLEQVLSRTDMMNAREKLGPTEISAQLAAILYATEWLEVCGLAEKSISRREHNFRLTRFNAISSGLGSLVTLGGAGLRYDTSPTTAGVLAGLSATALALSAYSARNNLEYR